MANCRFLATLAPATRAARLSQMGDARGVRLTGLTRAHTARACGSLSINLHLLCAGKRPAGLATHGGAESCSVPSEGALKR